MIMKTIARCMNPETGVKGRGNTPSSYYNATTVFIIVALSCMLYILFITPSVSSSLPFWWNIAIIIIIPVKIMTVIKISHVHWSSQLLFCLSLSLTGISKESQRNLKGISKESAQKAAFTSFTIVTIRNDFFTIFLMGKQSWRKWVTLLFPPSPVCGQKYPRVGDVKK